MFSGGPLLFLIFILIGVVRAVPLRDFYNFSGNATCLPPIDDSSQTAQLNPGYTFFGESFDSINVSENGNLSPNGSSLSYSPQMLPRDGFPVMAVFWGDVDTEVPEPRGTVCFQRTNDSDLVQKALADIQRAHPTLSTLDYLFISTWDHVGYYDNGTDKTNTFQSVLAVSGNETFVIYIYADNLIQWTNSTSGGHALVGYNAGHGDISYTVPTSMEEGIINITFRTNVRRPGMCVFQVDKVVSQPQQTCADAFRGVEIQFEAATYTFSENSSKTEVCLKTLDDVRYNFIVTFEARLTPPSNDITSSLLNITLEMNTTATCNNLTIHQDSIVEGNETFYLNLTSNDPDTIINGDVTAQTRIVITDSTVLGLRFSEHPLAVSERIGNMKLCLRKVPGTEVAPDILLNVTLVELSEKKLDGSAFDLPKTPFTFLSNNSEACLDIRVINDTMAQGNRSVSLGVKSQDSQFLVNGDVTNITFLDQQDFLGCKGEDDEWGITWPNTKADSQATSQCPGGMATRVCHLNMTWAVANASSCRSESIDRILDEALSSLSGTNATIESATRISGELTTATQRGPEISLLPSDLQSTNNIVERVLVVFESNVGNAANSNSSEALVDVFNNVLSEANQAGWTQLQTAGSGSQTLLQNAERFGRILASIVNGTSGNTTLMFTRENIFVAAERVNSGTEIVFPARSDQLGNFSGDMNETVQISIPAESLLQLTTGNSSNGAELYFVNIIFRNIGDFLPTNTTILNNARAESLVLSTQLGRMDGADIPADIVNDNPITLSFSFTASTQFISQYLGVFWNFSDPVGSGGWSSEGIQVISSVTRDNVTTVVFNSTHLTSFAVLVDVAGGLEEAPKEEKLALKIVSYIGCIISMVCLSITVVFYLAMGKKLFSAIHYFVHLNLALTLLVGYLVFVLGIELGNRNKVACGFVAALLQYLFLSAFCWMMCEGIMLYLMLIVVFSRLSKKWWFFMIVGYCPPLLFVASGLAARVEHYGVYGDDGELAFCWLSIEQGSIFAFVAPMLIIIMINTVFLVLAVKVLIRSKSQAMALTNKEKSINKAATILKATFILLPLLGVTWLFGLLTLNSNTTVFAWLFTIFNSLQGFAIFVFHVIRSTVVWNKLTSIFKKSKPKSLWTEKASSSSDGQHSTNALKELLHKKPLDTNENMYVVTSSALSTSMASESVANDEQ